VSVVRSHSAFRIWLTVRCLSHSSTPAPNYSQPEDRFTSRLPNTHPQISGYGKPGYPGQQWRINSYAGDDVRRYASNMPNKGVNPYASAFSTSQAPGFKSAMSTMTGGSIAPASMAQAPGFSSALEVAKPVALPNPSASFQTVRNAFSTSAAAGPRPSFGTGVNKPFKPPSMAKPSTAGHSHVATVETRLTYQNNAVILNPIAPNIPRSAGYSLPTKDDSFAFLRNLAKEEMEDIAPASARSSGSPNQSRKRGIGQPTVPHLKRAKS
jgi:hypothetical protein